MKDRFSEIIDDSCFFNNIHYSGAGVAQLAEQRIRNAQVNGSIPFAGSIFHFKEDL